MQQTYFNFKFCFFFGRLSSSLFSAWQTQITSTSWPKEDFSRKVLSSITSSTFCTGRNLSLLGESFVFQNIKTRKTSILLAHTCMVVSHLSDVYGSRTTMILNIHPLGFQSCSE